MTIYVKNILQNILCKFMNDNLRSYLSYYNMNQDNNDVTVEGSTECFSFLYQCSNKPFKTSNLKKN